METHLWLIGDDYGLWHLPSECDLYLLDTAICPRWFAERTSQWPKQAIIYHEVLGLALQNFIEKHKLR
jgi:hypothetical protein